LWINHPVDNQRAEFKQEQLLRARECGFEIPDTLITNDPLAALAFGEEHPDGIVCKPLRIGRVVHEGEEKLFFTSVIDLDQLRNFSRGGEPYLLQALIKKAVDIRITVIGDQCFAVDIDSQANDESTIDWRRRGSDLSHTKHTLPSELDRRCRRLVESYGLNFGAIDLAQRPDGSYVFFEINPNGQWAWIEQLCGLPVASHLADLLLAPC